MAGVFFRSVTVCTTGDFRATARRADGSPLSPLHGIKERALADGLRASVIAHMIENVNELGVLMEPNMTEALNADVPDDIHFKSLEERIVHMTNVTARVE